MDDFNISRACSLQCPRQRLPALNMAILSALVMAGVLGGAQIASGQLTLNIVDQNGLALPAVEVAVAGTVVTRQVKTDDDGQAVFHDLPIGSYRLSARLLGFVSESREVTVRSGVSTVVKIEVPLEWPTDLLSGKPIRDTITLHCGSPAPRSIETFWHAADAVAWIRINQQTVYDHWRLQEDGFPIVTVHDAQLLELFKPHPRLSPDTGAISILQEGGTIERPGLIERASASGSKLLHPHREYVAFLRWSDRWQRWTVEECDLGAVEITAVQGSASGNRHTNETWEARPANELLAILRQMKN
jgi:hypothetical protein